MQEYLVRFAQRHETFRLPELEALATMIGAPMEVVEYDDDSPFCIIRLPSDEVATSLITRSILALTISSLWGHGADLDSLHASIQSRMDSTWPTYRDAAFNFEIDSFRGKRTRESKNAIIESFDYLDLQGPIVMSPSTANPIVHTFVIGEEYVLRKPGEPYTPPKRLFFGRHLASSSRDVVAKYDLKKRFYISTTSMDAELALITANMSLAARGKIHYDPFTGTGSFPVACAHFGSCVLGSDLDGRMIRGAGKTKGKGPMPADRSVAGNFSQYNLSAFYLDGFVADLTNTPLRSGYSLYETKVTGRWIDGICCDPPYGVREGLKVLGSVREDLQSEVLLKDGRPAHLAEGYIPPKRAYSFEAMLGDILSFAFHVLVDGGRLCMWMPTANDEDIELAVPRHSGLKLVASSVQEFNKWSRRLLTYQRKKDEEVDWDEVKNWERSDGLKTGTADQLNQFRRKFFEGFKEQQDGAMAK